MTFWIFMLIMVLITPITFIVFGLLFANKPPKEINDTYGYRTKRSMTNQETWNFAHKYIGKLWFVYGLIIFPFSVAIMSFVFGTEINLIGTVGGILVFLQMIPLIFSIILTEKTLKKNFDEYGKRK